MASESEDFREVDKIKVLLWSDRHCCLCGKACTTDIEIHHIEKEGPIEHIRDIDNAIPLCLSCHGKIDSYNPQHPVGTKYKINEIKARREQIYERYTRNLVPPIDYSVFQKRGKRVRVFPDVGFMITNLGDYLQAQASLTINAYLGKKDLGPIKLKVPYYSGDIKWNLNPRYTIFGHFPLPKICIDSNESVKVEINATIIDVYDRPHKRLPVCYNYVRSGDYWYLDPTSFSEMKPYI